MDERFFCASTSAIWRFVGYVIYIAKIIVPLIIIILGVIELSKCVVSGKDDEIKSTASKLAKKFIIGLIIFFIPTVTKLVFSLIEEADQTMLFAEPCIQCLTSPFGDTCKGAVEAAEVARKERNNAAYVNYYQSIKGDKSVIVDYSDEPSGGNPTDPPEQGGDNPGGSTPTTPVGPINKPDTATSYTFKASDGTEMNYWVLAPKNAKANLPMIVFLHGGGNDLSSKTPKDQQFNMLVTVDHPVIDAVSIYGENLPFILLIPHNYSAWVNTGYDTLYEMINSVAKDYNVNTRKISITGVSNGGWGTWKFVGMHPDMFSKIYIISSGAYSVTEEDAPKYKDLQIKGISETVNRYYSYMEMNCNKIKALNGKGICSIEPRSDKDHSNILSVAYPKEVFQWLIS